MRYNMRGQEYEKFARSLNLPRYPLIGYARGFAYNDDVYINDDAFYVCKRDYSLLIQHEYNHIKGLTHTVFGVMSPWGLIRLLTTL